VIQKREGLDVFHTSFEELYPYKSLDSLSDKDYMYSPVLIKTPNEIFIAITESDLDDYPGMFLQGTGRDALQGAFAGYPLEEKMAIIPKWLSVNARTFSPGRRVPAVFPGG
jgi:alpha-glucosidase